MTQINYFKAWIVFYPITIFGSLAGGYLAGTLLLSLGFTVETHAAIFKFFGLVAGMIASFFAYQFSVKKFIVEANEHPTSNPD